MTPKRDRGFALKRKKEKKIFSIYPAQFDRVELDTCRDTASFAFVDLISPLPLRAQRFDTEFYCKNSAELRLQMFTRLNIPDTRD